MSTLIDAVDALDNALNLVKAAEMAVAGILDATQRKALSALLYAAERDLDAGIDHLEACRTGGEA